MLKKAASLIKKSILLGITGGIAYKYFKKDHYIDGNPLENQKSLPPHLRSFIMQKVSEDLKKNKALELENNYFTFNTHHKEKENKNYFTEEEIVFLRESKAKEIIEATYNIHSMCLQLVDEVVKDDKLMDLFGIPVILRPLVRDSWEKRETDFLGRFDFLIDRKGNVKLLEYNADTPTLLIESGRVQNLVYENIKKTELKDKILNEEKIKFIENLMKGSEKESIKTGSEILTTGDANEQLKGQEQLTDDYILSEKDHCNFMNGKFYYKGRTFFRNYDSIDNLFQFIETNVYKAINYVSSLDLFQKEKETQKQITEKAMKRIQEEEQKLRQTNQENIEENIEIFSERINFSNYSYLENSITEFWRSVFSASLERTILFVSNHAHEEEKQTTNYVSHLAEDAIKKTLEDNAENKSEKRLESKVIIENEDCSDLHYNVDTTNRNVFVTGKDKTNYDILWKLYPYEWLVDEEFGDLFEMYETHGLFDKPADKKKLSLKLNLMNIYNRNTNYVKKSLLREQLDLTNEQLKIEENNKSITQSNSSVESTVKEEKETLPISKQNEELFKTRQEEIMKESLVLNTHFLEPAWKLVVSSKALLPALYERYPNHKNLIPAYFDNPYALKDKINYKNLFNLIFDNLISDSLRVNTWVIKPTFGREGKNIQIVQKFFLEELAKKAKNDITNKDTSNRNLGEISEKSYLQDIKNPNHTIPIGNNIYQAFSHSEKLDDKYVTIGSWTVNGVPSAIIVRGSDNEILQDDHSYFYPHLIHFDDSTKFVLHTENQLQSTLRRELYGDEVLKYYRIFGDFYEKFKFEEKVSRRRSMTRYGSGGNNSYSSSNEATKSVVKNSSSSANGFDKSIAARAATGSTSAKASSSS